MLHNLIVDVAVFGSLMSPVMLTVLVILVPWKRFRYWGQAVFLLTLACYGLLAVGVLHHYRYR